MKLSEIIERLRPRSGHPQNLPGAQKIGSGSERIAYRVGRYVIKRASSWNTTDQAKKHRLANGVEVRTVQTRRLRGRWDIQPYAGPVVYTALDQGKLTDDAWGHIWNMMWNHRHRQKQGWSDFHAGNVAYVSPTRFVQFD